MNQQGITLIKIVFFLQTFALFVLYYSNVRSKVLCTIEQNITTIRSNQDGIIQVKTPNRVSLFDIGMKYRTDKVYTHHYEKLYEKHLSRYRNTAVRFLEIGLGCKMAQVGASAQTWREYLGPEADIHLIEYDKKCGIKWENTVGKQVKIKTLFYKDLETKDLFHALH